MNIDFNLLIGLLSNNPEGVLNSMVGNNPQLSAILNQAKVSGMSMKDYVMQYAKQNNIDIQPLLRMMQQKGIK